MTQLQSKTPSPRFLARTAMAAALVAVAIAGGGFLSRAHTARQNAQWSQAQAVPTVSLAKLQTEQDSSVELPGTAQPFQKAQIFARVSGYLHGWQADIGSRVQAGQTLAVIDAPDLDQQLVQARGDLEMAKANAALADLTARRWTALEKSGAVSQQVIDEKAGDSAAKLAAVHAAQGRLRSIGALAAYKRIASPFAGTVTARKTDIGALINAGSNGQELFEVSDLSRLRIYVQVPQTLASGLKVGDKAEFSLPESPGQSRPATIAAISHALDAASRTMLIQLQAGNTDGAIGAGAYCQIRFHRPAQSGTLRLPATALITTNAGSRVAVVGAGNTVSFKSVMLGHDYGTAVDVISGLAPDDRVIDNPPETLRQGDAVQISHAGAA